MTYNDHPMKRYPKLLCAVVSLILTLEEVLYRIIRSPRVVNLWQLAILICAWHGAFYITDFASQFLMTIYTGIFSELVVMLSIAFLLLPIVALGIACFLSMALPNRLKKGFMKRSVTTAFQNISNPCGQKGEKRNAY